MISRIKDFHLRLGHITHITTGYANRSLSFPEAFRSLLQAPMLASDSPRPSAGGLLFILGPCVMESEEFTWEMARELQGLAKDMALSWVFKASFDKANRSSGESFRGPGREAGCRILAEIRAALGVTVTTDVHCPEDVNIAAKHVDILQIPAFLCRQSDLIEAAAASGRTVNVKKGQFLSPWEVENIARKIRGAGGRDFYFTERGTTFGYNNLVADMRSLYWIREMGYRVIFDATHSVQRPGGLGGTTGGDAKLAPVLARAAVAAGCDGVFMETHFDPAKALSDGPNQIPFRELRKHLETLISIQKVCHE